MKDLTKSQLDRLDAAARRVDQMVEKRPLLIRGELELAAIIRVFDTVVALLEAGQTVCIGVTDERGSTAATASLALEPA